MSLSRTMTIVATPEGLCVVNSVRLSPEGEAALAALGEVRHVVKLADGHGRDDPYYLRDGATFWSTASARHPAIPRGQTLGARCPIPGARVIRFEGSSEAALWLPHGGGTLVTCDAVQNHADTEGASWAIRWIGPWLGFEGLVAAPPMWQRVKKMTAEQARSSVSVLGDLAFENLVTGHGPPILGGADRQLRARMASGAR